MRGRATETRASRQWMPRSSCLLLAAAACGTPSSGETGAQPTTFTTAPPMETSAEEGTTVPDPGTSGSELTTGTTAAVDETTAEPPKFDIGVQPDFETPECLQCSLTIASQQSGVLDVFGANVFATAVLPDTMGVPQDVYALGTYGNGRFIATADSSLPF